MHIYVSVRVTIYCTQTPYKSTVENTRSLGFIIWSNILEHLIHGFCPNVWKWHWCHKKENRNLVIFHFVYLKVDHVLIFAWRALWWSFHPVSPSITAPPPRLCGAVFIITTLSHHQSDWWPLCWERLMQHIYGHAQGMLAKTWKKKKNKKNGHIVKDVFPQLLRSSPDGKKSKNIAQWRDQDGRK